MQVHMYATYKLQFRVTLVHEVAAVVRTMRDLDQALIAEQVAGGSVLRSGSHIPSASGRGWMIGVGWACARGPGGTVTGRGVAFPHTPRGGVGR